jgi:uroporphyrinogen-III decarboxylase
MNVRENFLRCMRFQPCDRVPNFELGYWGHTVERWLGEGMPAEEGDRGGFYGHAYFGVDDRPFLPVDFGPVPSLEHAVVEETDRYIIARDGDGALRKAMKEGTVRGTRPSMDQFISFAVQGPDDWERLKSHFDPHSPGRYPADFADRVQQLEGRDSPLCAVPTGAFGLFSHLRRFLGTEGVSYAWYDQPQLLHEMLDFFTDFAIETLRPGLEAIQCDYFNFFEDFAFKNGPLLSPAVFREFLMPRYRRIVEFVRGHGIDIIWFDSDGNFDPLIPLLIDVGVTCIWPLEVAASNDPRELRRRFGHNLALSGGIDKRELTRDRAAIRAELQAKIPPLLDNGGYIPTIDHAVSPDIPYDNWLYYLELKRQMLERGA